MHASRLRDVGLTVLALSFAILGGCLPDDAEEAPDAAADGAAGAGGSSPCAAGISETTWDRCSDGCDNDEDGTTDCNDVGCCAVRASCGASTYCGKLPNGNGWDGELSLDDALVEAIDPATLPSGVRPCHAPALVRVEYAVDGDTLQVTDLQGGDTTGRVRVIGVDTPEVGHEIAPSECYGDEAAMFTAQLGGHAVWLTFDTECRDAYDRLLAYVFVGPGKNDSLERQLLRRGYATAYPYGHNRTFEQLYDSDEQEAVSAGAGLWGACP